MITYHKFFFIILSLLILSSISCTINRFGEFRPIQGLVLQDSLSINYTVDKVSYSPINRTFFLLNRTENTIRIYKNGDFFNVVGGSGFSNENFRRLTDIFVGIDGSLFALDSFDRTIKRFDNDGIYLNQFSLENISSPERFVMSNFAALFVYDAHSKEIFALDPFDMSITFSFGKFQIDRADAFFISGDYINIFDNSLIETNVFQINGLLENTFRGFTFMDAFRNILTKSFHTIVASREDLMLFSSLGRIEYFAIERDFFVFFIDARRDEFISWSPNTEGVNSLPIAVEIGESEPRTPYPVHSDSTIQREIRIYRGNYESR